MLIAALGSSFAAGPGIAPIVDTWARRSGRNYPRLVAEALGAGLLDLTASGATTADLLDHAQRRGLLRRPPQIAVLRPEVDLVLVTVGGNDVGYLRELRRLATTARHGGPRSPDRRFLTRIADPRTWTHLQDRLQSLVSEIGRRSSPAVRVLLVDYLPIVGEPSLRTRVPWESVFDDLAGRLSQALTGAASRTSAEFVSAPTRTPGDSEPWISGSDADPPFHPTAAGMRSTADRVLEHLTSRMR